MADRVVIALVRAYQVGLAPLTGGACRFTPSCSAYAIEAVQIHGAARGLWLALRRVARCHPWGGFGHDPVPHTHGPAASPWRSRLRRRSRRGVTAWLSGRKTALQETGAGGSSPTLES